MKRLWTKLISALLMLGVSVLAAQAGEPLTIGVLKYRTTDQALNQWQATEDALNRALPDYDFRLEALDIYELDAALSRAELDFVITNPGNYAMLEYDHHISRIATAQDDLPVASTLVTNRGFETLDDLTGHRLAIVSPEAFGGFQIVWAEMLDIDPQLPRRIELMTTGYPMRAAAEAVLDGHADAAVLRTCMLEDLQREDAARFQGLQAFAVNTESSKVTGCSTSSAIYPGWPFAKAPDTDPALSKQVAVALLQMEQGNLWTVPLDYQPVHDLLRKLQIGPYAHTGTVSIREFIADYQEWLIVIAAALMFWALYSVRIETLVRQRTKALKETNAALMHEIAERKRAEEADRQHRLELEHVAKLSILGEMASSIAHELNQPLSAISNYAQGCLMRINAGRFSEEDMGRASQEMAGQAERAATVVKRIRAFVRKRESQMAPVDMGALLEDCAAIYVASANRAGVTVTLQIDDTLPRISADFVQLQQVVLNLVQNAIDAMGDTPPEARTIVLGAARCEDPARGPGLCVSVRDHGYGMTAEAMDHFAEAFYTTKAEGIGLGLALSRSIIEAHGGWMRAETPEDGPGLRVLIWLPIKDTDD
nr:PhnD/SsuA/transferrin family substrate-binding protein [uncultured Celeribacter sp.]